MKEFYGKKFRKFEKKNFDESFFFFKNFFGCRVLFSTQIISEIFFRFSFLLFCAGRGASAASGGGGAGERSERQGGVGERSEPSAGGLAQAPEGGVSAS